MSDIAQKARFTPGPWETPAKRLTYNDGEGCCFSDGDYEVYPPLGESGPVAVTNSPENARLISAAPELYASLKKFMDHFGDPFKNAQAALDKATGIVK